MASESYNKHKEIPKTRLTELRLKTRLNKTEVADLLGVTISVVSHHEIGVRGISHKGIINYSKIFKCYTYELFVDTEKISEVPVNRIQEMRYRSRLTIEEVAYTILRDKSNQTVAYDNLILRIAKQELGEEGLSHADILSYCRVFKCYSYELFRDAVNREDPWADTNGAFSPWDEESDWVDLRYYDDRGNRRDRRDNIGPIRKRRIPVEQR